MFLPHMRNCRSTMRSMIELKGLSHAGPFLLESIRDKFCLPNHRELEGKRLVSPVGGPHSVRGVVGTAVMCNHRKTGVYYNAQQWGLVHSRFFFNETRPH